jgi:hypothetical protein
MRNHQHYYHWTIEWEQLKSGEWLFYANREVIQPYSGEKQDNLTQIGCYVEIDEGISKAQDLIDEIITNQNLIAEKVLNMEPY